jgi:hypothetical protein
LYQPRPDPPLVDSALGAICKIMKKIIHHIRKQPEHIKRHILHIAILVCAVVLFTFWVHSLGTTLTNTDTQVKMSQDLKPFSILKDNILEQYNNKKESDLNTEQYAQ